MDIDKRVEELERKIKELEARPISYPPVYIPYPVPQPYYIPTPIPYYPQPYYPGGPYYVSCGCGVGVGSYTAGVAGYING